MKDFEFERLNLSDFIIFKSAVRMAEWSKALRSGRSTVFWARVRIPLLTLVHGTFHIIVLHSSTIKFFL